MIITPGKQGTNRTPRKDLSYQVSTNAPLELFFSLNAIANPKLHIDCEAWASRRFNSLSLKLQEEIRFMTDHYAQWLFATDVVQKLTGRMGPDECTIEMAADMIRSLDRNEFAYLFLGLAAFGYDREMVAGWYEMPEKLRLEDLGEQQNFFSLEDVVYFLKNTEEIRERLIHVMMTYWEESFCEDWKQLEAYERTMIEKEQRLVAEIGVLEYIRQLHKDVEVDEERICFHKDPDYSIDVSKIRSVCINPSVFLGGALGANIVDEQLFIAKGLNFQQAMASRPVPENVLELSRVCSDETRMKMVRILWNGQSTTQKLAETLGISPSTASQHLKLLKSAGIVDSYKINKYVYYFVKRDCFAEYVEWLMNYLER